MSASSVVFMPTGQGRCVLRVGGLGLCLIVVPLALAWGSSASAAVGDEGSPSATGASSSSRTPASGSDTPSSSESNGFYQDTRPVTTENSGWGIAPSGPGTSNPLGFASGFAPRGCAPGRYLTGVGSAEAATVVERPEDVRRNGTRYVQLSITGAETYTDNVNLDSDHRESDFITTVAPRLDACSSTGRIRGQASYQLQGVVYANHGSDNDVYNDVAGSATIDLVENHLYLDVNTDYGRRVIDPSVGYARSNIIRPDANKTSAWRSNISPYVVQSLGVLGRGMLRYRYGHSEYGDSSVPDTNVQGVSASLTSPATVEPISWQAQAVTQWVDYSGGDQQRFIDRYRDVFAQIFGEDALPDTYRNRNQTQYFDSATLQLGYRVSRLLKFTALGGVEDRYRNNGENDRWSAPRWQVGVQLGGERNSLELDYGHRFYGASYTLLARHRGRLADLSLSYSEQPSSPGLDALDRAGSGSGYGFGTVGSIEDILGGYGPSYEGTNSLLDRGVYVRKRWQARVGFDTALTQTDITGFIRHEDYQSDFESDSRSHGVELDTRYDLGPRTSIVPSARWEHHRRNTSRVFDSDDYEAGISLVRAVTPSAKAAIGYSRRWRDENYGRGYRENQVTLQFRKAF